MLSNKELILLGLRSFFLQSMWNFERMQHLGFAYIISPTIKKISNNSNKYREIMLKHFNFFNIHPYMVGFISGLVVAFEEKGLREGKDFTNEIKSFKDTMAGPLAAIGDSFFWGTWRPTIGVLVVTIFSILELFNIQNDSFYILVIIFIMIVYNIPHIYIRFWSVFRSYKRETEVIDYIRKWHDLEIIQIVRKISLILVLIAFSLLLYIELLSFKFILLLLGIELLFIFIIKSNVSIAKIIYILLIIIIGLTYLNLL